MSDQANLKSTDAIEAVRAVVLMFAKQAEEGLTECDLEMRRLMDWLQHDRPAFWKEQVRRAHDGVQKAKQDLHRCLMYPVGVNDRPSCTEERAALKKAEAKLAYCEQKQEKLKHWVREISHELHTYEGRTARLKEVIEADAPQAAAALGQILLRIEEYTNLTSPTASVSAGTSSPPADEPDEDAAEADSSDASKDASADSPTPES